MAPDAVLAQLQTIAVLKHEHNLETLGKIVHFATSLVPLVSAIDAFKKGEYGEAALSLAGDATMFLGFAPALAATKLVSCSNQALKVINRAAIAIEGGITVTRLAQGFHALNSNQPGAWGYFGDATLRLFGLSANAIAWLKKGKCFVEGTLVHTEAGLKPIEAVAEGERVWAFDRWEETWRLCPVSACFSRTSERLTTIRFADGEELTATDGHPYWVIEGEHLAGRPCGDHGHDEPLGPTPGRWIGADYLRAGDVLLARTGKTRQVVEVWTRDEVAAVYNLSVGELHAYAVGSSGVLAHNTLSCGEAADVVKTQVTASEVLHPTSTATGATPQAGTKASKHANSAAVPGPGLTSPGTLATNNSHWTCQNGVTAHAFYKTPHTPEAKGGRWRNADGTEGIRGESIWVAADGRQIRYEKMHPVFQPVHGREYPISMKGINDHDFYEL